MSSRGLKGKAIIYKVGKLVDVFKEFSKMDDSKEFEEGSFGGEDFKREDGEDI